MKKLLVAFCLLNPTLAYCMHHKPSQPIALQHIEHHGLSHSRSPGDWPPTEQSILEARQSYALIEHQEAVKISRATKLLAFLGNQSLQLIEMVKVKCGASMGDKAIDTELQKILIEMVKVKHGTSMGDKAIDTESQEMFEETSAAHHEKLYNELAKAYENLLDLHDFSSENNPMGNSTPSLNKKMYLAIIQQALILNESARLGN